MNVFANSRDIALIFICLQGFLMALVPLALFGGMAYGVYKLHRWLRPALQVAQAEMQKVNDKVNEVAQKITSPMVEVRSKERMVTTILGRFIPGGKA